MCRSRGGESSNFELKSVFEISDLRGEKIARKVWKRKKKREKNEEMTSKETNAILFRAIDPPMKRKL